jgi:ribosome-associated protein
VIKAQTYRTKERNRRDARERLAHLLEKAAAPVHQRVKTRVSAAERERRLEEKRQRGLKKQDRKIVRLPDCE